MKYFILCLCIFISSCKENVKINAKVNKDSSKTNVTQDTKAKQPMNDSIAPLPYGPKISIVQKLNTVPTDFYTKKIAKNSYKGSSARHLPKILKYRYINIGDEFSSDCVDKEDAIEKYFKIFNYTERLPDFKNFELYYVTADTISANFSDDIIVKCPDFVFDKYGLLTIYDKASKTADVLLIYFERNSDAYNVRKFYIDEKYVIYVHDESYGEGDEEVDKYAGTNYKITLSGNGPINIKVQAN